MNTGDMETVGIEPTLCSRHLDPAGLEAAAKASLAGLDCPGDPTDLWLAATEAAVRAYLAAVVPVTPTTENHDTVEWLRSTSREFASHGFRSCDVSLLDAERVARAERERGFAAGRAAERAATKPLREGLAFYANAENYVGGEVGWWGKTVSGDPLWCMDFGVTARNTLAGGPTYLPSEPETDT